ncbi:hypothetical protein GCM10027053_24200 [Intrasporangium mesophilum]
MAENNLAKPTDIGFTTFQHASGTFTACICLAAWLPFAEELGLARGLIQHNLDIIQLTGDAQAAAGTHRRGGAFDVRQDSDEWVELFREMGAPASWRRNSGAFEHSPHAHGVLNGCPHNGLVAYQLKAQEEGFNGLGPEGHGGPDPHPAPTVRRSWIEGITWAQEQLAGLAQGGGGM